MFFWVIAAVFTWFGYLVNGQFVQYQEILAIYRADTRRQQMIDVAVALELYYRKNGAYPTSLTVLASTQGFEHVRSFMNNLQGYAVSPTITDGTWSFKRAVAITHDVSSDVSQAEYLAANGCGTGGYDTAVTWCPDKTNKTSMWFRRETREYFEDEMNTQMAHLKRLDYKLVSYFNGNQKFPDKDSSNVSLAADSITSIAALAGYSGTAKTCSGQYQYMGIPIDCSDMYDIWGGLIGYQFVDSSHIILVSEPPVFDASGNRVIVALDRQ